MSVNLTWRTQDGVIRAAASTIVPPNGGLSVDARTFLPGCLPVPPVGPGGGCAFLFGTVEIAHNGSPQALVGSQTTLSASTGLSFDTILFQRQPW